MFTTDSVGGAVEILKLGVIGLGFILALMAFLLLAREQKKSEPHASIIRAIYSYMAFSVVLCAVGLFAQIGFTADNDTINKLQHENTSLNKEAQDTKNLLQVMENDVDRLTNNANELEGELNKIKNSAVNWDYSPSGHKLTCKVNGKRVGSVLNCKDHNTCNNRNLNRAICALKFSHLIWSD